MIIKREPVLFRTTPLRQKQLRFGCYYPVLVNGRRRILMADGPNHGAVMVDMLDQLEKYGIKATPSIIEQISELVEAA